MMLYAIKFTFEYGPNVLLRSVTPEFIFGSGPDDPTVISYPDIIGDIEVKNEARKMMKEFKPTAEEELNKLYYDAEKGLLPPPFDSL